jgi:aminoglycoside/choline kinase family phosphotransferase
LLFDPYVAFSRAECEELLADYESKRQGRGKPVASDSRETFRLCGIQRLMQALGAYGFLGLVKGNKAFLDHIPAAMASLQSLVAEIGELRKLDAVLNRLL